MVPAVCILQELQKVKDEEDTLMFVSEQSANLDKWDQWILEKVFGGSCSKSRFKTCQLDCSRKELAKSCLNS